MNEANNQEVLQAINRAIKHKARFFAYRLPGSESYEFGAQLIEQQSHIGFAIYPFAVTGEAQPTFIARQYDAKAFLKVHASTMESCTSLRTVENNSTEHDDYLQLAHRAIDEMKQGKFRKLVLSRTIVGGHVIDDWAGIFHSLCENNRQSFVFVYNTAETGAWLGVTPEQFLSSHHRNVSCMALAATKPFDSDRPWTAKEVEEQAFVADFIAQKMQELGIKYTKSETIDRRAGNVKHICNLFTAERLTMSQIEKMKKALHPTPAISGLPQVDAVKFVMQNEKHRRLYYGGYIGPVYATGDFDFFVNLRSMMFDSSRYCIYSGGGLTAQSNADDEWEETEMKSQLLREHMK